MAIKEVLQSLFKGFQTGSSHLVDSLVLKEGASAGKVVLKASPSLGDKIVKTSVSVKAELNNMSASRSLNVVVNKVSRPEFREG